MILNYQGDEPSLPPPPPTPGWALYPALTLPIGEVQGSRPGWLLMPLQGCQSFCPPSRACCELVSSPPTEAPGFLSLAPPSLVHSPWCSFFLFSSDFMLALFLIPLTKLSTWGRTDMPGPYSGMRLLWGGASNLPVGWTWSPCGCGSRSQPGP